MAAQSSTSKQEYGDYITVNGKRLSLSKHPTDFSVIGQTTASQATGCREAVTLSANMIRISAVNRDNTAQLMAEARKDGIAYPIYQLEGTDEEVIIDDHILLNLRQEGTGEIERILQEFHLVPEGRMGKAHVLRVTEATRRSPLEAANEIAERDGVESCSPQIMLDQQRH